MAQFRKAVITQNGLALIQKTQMQNVRLEFTRIVTGSGEYTETEELNGLSALKEPKQEFPFSSVSVVDQQTIKLAAAITNKDLQQAYYMREIGVMANDPDNGEILYSIAVTYPGKADYLPAYDGFAPVTIGLDSYQAVSDSENVTIRADTSAYALARDLEIYKIDTDNRIQELDRKVQDLPVTVGMEITIQQSGWVEDTGIGGYHADIEVSAATDDTVPALTVLPESMEAAQECGMFPGVMTMPGIIRVYAWDIPQTDIQANIMLAGTRASGGGSSGGTTGNYVLPTATRTRLGGVRIGDGVSVKSDGTLSIDGEKVAEKVIATPEEVRAMLDDVYNDTVN